MKAARFFSAFDLNRKTPFGVIRTGCIYGLLIRCQRWDLQSRGQTSQLRMLPD